MNIADYIRERRSGVERELDRLIPPAATVPESVHAAMRHSVFAGGKRIRPILAIAAAEACGSSAEIETAACALECVHTYSLIHDDLPALDDDDFRRGKPTCHKAFGEACAILAGDALLTLAFKILAELNLSADTRVALASELATAAGTEGGMIAGQVADLEAQSRAPRASQVEFIHRSKTAALIRASVRFGAFCARANSDQHAALSLFGEQIGLAFQIVDDVLDVVASTSQLGKTAGKDANQSKATFPALYGIEGSRDRAARCLSVALEAIEGFGAEAHPLREIAELIVSRSN